jgi:phosphoglycolate phosphatase
MIETKSQVLFITDIDGTLLDSKVAIGNVAAQTIEEFTGRRVQSEIFFPHIGVPIKTVFQDYLSSEQIEAALPYFRKRLIAEGLVSTVPMEGSVKVLEKFKSLGVKICAASNKIGPLAEKVLDQQELLAIFDGIYGSDKHSPKPDPEMIQQAMADFPSTLNVMFGDRPEDVISGNLAGATTVFLSGKFNYLLEQENCKPAFQVKCWSDLLELPPLKQVWEAHEIL